MHAAFLLFTALLENHVEPSALCVFGPWLPLVALALWDESVLRLAVHLTALATLWPHPVAYACSLCALLCYAQHSAASMAAAAASLLLYVHHCPCGAPSETQVIAIMWAEAVEAAYFIAARAL